MQIAEAELQSFMEVSGLHGVFFTRLSRDVIAPQAATWFIKEQDDNLSEKQNDDQYFQKVRKAAIDSKTKMIYRHGGRNDLGLAKADEKSERAWAVWGVPPEFSPEKLSEFLTGQGWVVADVPSESRSKQAPWRLKGRCDGEDDELFVYQVKANKHIRIVPWKTTHQKSKEEPEMLRGRSWYSSNVKYEELVAKEDADMEVSPTQHFTAAIAPTKLDSQSSEASNGHEKPARDSPNKKRQKVGESQCVTITGGEQGPGPTRVVNCGGDGDCGWRAAAYGLAMKNARSKEQIESIGEKVQQLGAALRGQCVAHLLNVDTSWQAFWAPDSQWSTTTEDGKIAQDVEQFKEVLARPKRWICAYGLQSISTLKKVTIVVFTKTTAGWKKVALGQKVHHSAPCIARRTLLRSGEGLQRGLSQSMA